MLLFLNIFLIICMFTMGALFGSFFSLATYRIPRRQDIVSTRSYCTSCKHRLEFLDLIPVLSYVIRGGKCKYCNEKISLRYLLLEITNGLLFVLLYCIFGYTFNLLIVVLCYAIAFVLIGSLIMKYKMSETEKLAINNKSNAKKGVFISELVVAMILFTFLIASAVVISRNYVNKSVSVVSRSNAVSLAVKNTEMALGTSYDNLNSFSNVENVDNITYNIETIVTKYSDKDFTKKDIIKIIETKVKYMLYGKPYEFSLKTLKVKVV